MRAGARNCRAVSTVRPRTADRCAPAAALCSTTRCRSSPSNCRPTTCFSIPKPAVRRSRRRRLARSRLRRRRASGRSGRGASRCRLHRLRALRQRGRRRCSPASQALKLEQIPHLCRRRAAVAEPTCSDQPRPRLRAVSPTPGRSAGTGAAGSSSRKLWTSSPASCGPAANCCSPATTWTTCAAPWR